MRALFTAATGMEAQQLRIDTVANNLANVTTTGFKRSRANFQDLFYDTVQAPGAESAAGEALPTGIQIGHGVRLASMGRVYTQGDRTNTGRNLDLAVDGEGFFQLQRVGGETVFTRDGSFQVNRDGTLVTSQGLEVVPPIQIPPDAVQITILADGTVSVLTGQSNLPTDVGQIELARFVNPAGLRAVGGNVLVATDASGDPETGVADNDGFGAISQGFLESSNVNIAEELVEMILAQRAFEVSSRVIQAGDEMLRTASQLQR